MVTSIFKVDNKDDNVTKNNYNNITLYLYSALRLTQKLESILTPACFVGQAVIVTLLYHAEDIL